MLTSIKTTLLLAMAWILLNSFTTFAQPRLKSIWYAANLGLGLHTSDVTDEEKNFADQNGIYIIPEGSTTQSAVNYRYLGYKAGLNVEYQAKPMLSFGISYQYNHIKQIMCSDNNVQMEDPKGIMSYSQLGPILTKWFTIRGIMFNVSGSAGIVWGHLNRAPVLADNLSKFDDWTPEFGQAMAMYNDNLNGDGYGATLEFYYFYNSLSGLFSRIGLKFDYATMDFKDPLFVYIDNTSIYNFQFVVSLGYMKIE